MRLKDVAGLEVETFIGRQGLRAGSAPVVALENVSDGVLRNVRAVEGSGTFLEFRGSEDEGHFGLRQPVA